MADGAMLGGGGRRLDSEVGYGLPVGSRFVGTPRVGVRTSEYGRDYRLGYGLQVLEEGSVRRPGSKGRRATRRVLSLRVRGRWRIPAHQPAAGT